MGGGESIRREHSDSPFHFEIARPELHGPQESAVVGISGEFIHNLVFIEQL